MAHLFRDRPDFEATIDAAGDRLGVDPAIVEKDYWVSQILGALARDFPSDLVFKGGTSLSKGYGLIHRFSEDVDLLVVRGDRGASATDTLMKAMGECGADALSSTLAPAVTSSKGKHRTYDIAYPRSRPAAWLTSQVRLEMGTRGGPTPNSGRSISSLLADALVSVDPSIQSYVDLTPFEIRVLHPARTLVEKLSLVNALARDCAANATTDFPVRQGRHFYDIYMLLAHEPTLELLRDRAQFREIVTDCERVSREEFGTGYKRPDRGYAAGEAVTAPAEVGAELRRAHERSQEMYFGRDPYPTWEQVVERIRMNATLL